MTQMYQDFANDAIATLNEVGMDALLIISTKTANESSPWLVGENKGDVKMLRCIFTKNKEKSINGILAKEGDLLCVALPTKESLTTINVVNNAYIMRDGVKWTVVGLEILKPTTIEILYRFLLRK